MALSEHTTSFSVTVKVGATESIVNGLVIGPNQYQDLTEAQITEKVRAAFNSTLKIVLQSRRKAHQP